MEGVKDVARPIVTLAGDGEDIYSLIGFVSKALEGAGLRNDADEFVERTIGAPSYGAVLELSREYVKFETGGFNEPEAN